MWPPRWDSFAIKNRNLIINICSLLITKSNIKQVVINRKTNLIKCLLTSNFKKSFFTEIFWVVYQVDLRLPLPPECYSVDSYLINIVNLPDWYFIYTIIWVLSSRTINSVFGYWLWFIKDYRERYSHTLKVLVTNRPRGRIILGTKVGDETLC